MMKEGDGACGILLGIPPMEFSQIYGREHGEESDSAPS